MINFRKKLLKKYFFLFLFCLPILPVYSIQQKDMEKVIALVEKVDRYYQQNQKMKGFFTLYVNGSEKKGYFLFQAPDKLKLFFGPEETEEPEKFRYIISNGSILWIYLPKYQVLIEQEIPEYFKQIGKLGMNISRFFASYNTLQVQEETENNQKSILLTLKNPIKNNIPYEELTFIISENGFVRGMKGKTIKNNKPQYISFYRYGLVKNPDFTEKDFRVRPSGDIQILRNVLIKTKK